MTIHDSDDIMEMMKLIREPNDRGTDFDLDVI